MARMERTAKCAGQEVRGVCPHLDGNRPDPEIIVGTDFPLL